MKTIYSLPVEGGCLKGRGVAEDERERSQPPALRATSFQRKEGECLFPASSFRAKARNLFRSRSGEAVRSAGNGKHRASCDLGVRRLMQTALRRKTETGDEKDPSAALGMTKRGGTSHIVFQSHSGSQPPPLRGTSFQRKEGDTRMPFSPYRHFERKRDIFFVRDRSGKVRTADSGKHRTLCDVGSRCFMQTALRRKRETKKIPRLRSG